MIYFYLLTNTYKSLHLYNIIHYLLLSTISTAERIILNFTYIDCMTLRLLYIKPSQRGFLLVWEVLVTIFFGFEILYFLNSPIWKKWILNLSYFNIIKLEFFWIWRQYVLDYILIFVNSLDALSFFKESHSKSIFLYFRDFDFTSLLFSVNY